MGNTQPLANGNVLVGWGSQPYFTEYDSSGRPLLDATFPAPDIAYRVNRAAWVGLPTSGRGGGTHRDGEDDCVRELERRYPRGGLARAGRARPRSPEAAGHQPPLRVRDLDLRSGGRELHRAGPRQAWTRARDVRAVRDERVTEPLVLTGSDLTVEDVWRVAVEQAPVGLGEEARNKIRAARELVERAVYGVEEHTYGVNTGFGRFHTVSIPAAHTEELQMRLLRSHAAGVGEPYPDEIVRAAMLLRANALAEGHSGAREETVELLVEALNRGLVPHVPSRGSVGRAVTSRLWRTWRCP